MQENQNINVDINDTEEIKCKECDSPFFQNLISLRKISPLVSPTGQEQFLALNVGIICVNCGKLFLKEEDDNENLEEENIIIQ